MSIRRHLILALALMILMPPDRLTADDSLTSDEAREAAAELADAVGQDYDCTKDRLAGCRHRRDIDQGEPAARRGAAPLFRFIQGVRRAL